MALRSSLAALTIGAVCIFYASCSQNNQQTTTSRKKPTAPLGSISALPTEVIHPTDNPYNVEKAELGRLLFYDPILSGPMDISCATCHHPEFGYAESLPQSIGVGGKGLGESRTFGTQTSIPFAKRNSQSILNTAFNGIDQEGRYQPDSAPMFWDLRAKSLEDQSLHPIRQMEEMRGLGVKEEKMIETVLQRIRAIPAYREKFSKAFDGDREITEKHLAKAIACFERTLVANNSRFDQYMRGDKMKLSGPEKEGMELFMQAGCARCHSGPMLSDFKVHVLGAPDGDKRTDVDSGFQGSFAFRTPSLRNLRFTAPYMHSGKIHTLENVLTFYEDLRGTSLGSRHVQPHQLDTLAKQVRVEFRDLSRIMEFLNTMNDSEYDRKIPASVPSGLPVGGQIARRK
jgi:cytochrome c peroxidase